MRISGNDRSRCFLTSSYWVGLLSFYDHANHVHYIGAGGAGDEKVSYRFEKIIGIISRKVIEGI